MTISLPDSTYEATMKLARRLGISRSELVAQALAAFIEAHEQDITARLNKVYATEDSALDDFLVQLQVVSARCGFSDSW
ncbi:MAG: CopG family transcriptional regulator [Anaerolinea sp.]|nr:CopG family transcriptional regulator [Anaerolinea sp.]